MNEFKIWIFAYNSDRRVYMFWYLIKSICFFSNIKKKEYLFLLIKFKEKKVKSLPKKKEKSKIRH